MYVDEIFLFSVACEIMNVNDDSEHNHECQNRFD